MVSSDNYQKEAVSLYKQGEYKKCLDICTKAIEDNVQTATLYNVQSITLMALKRYDEAYTAINAALQLAPQNETFIKNKAKIERIKDKNKEEPDIELPDEDEERPIIKNERPARELPKDRITGPVKICSGCTRPIPESADYCPFCGTMAKKPDSHQASGITGTISSHLKEFGVDTDDEKTSGGLKILAGLFCCGFAFILSPIVSGISIWVFSLMGGMSVGFVLSMILSWVVFLGLFVCGLYLIFIGVKSLTSQS